MSQIKLLIEQSIKAVKSVQASMSYKTSNHKPSKPCQPRKPNWANYICNDTSKEVCSFAHKQTYNNACKSERGFTLIEVMVALAILAVVAVAASRASSAYLSSVDVLKTRTLAHFVAQNAAAELRVQQTWLTANRSQTIQSQGRDWQVQMNVANTLSPALKEVNISVAPLIDGEARAAVTDLTVIISDPQTASASFASFGSDGGNGGSL